MNNRDLPCDVCRDLMPLVRDGVASDASRRMVERHLAGCPACQAIWRGEEPPPPDDRRILGRIQSRVRLWMGGVLAAGLLLGLLFSSYGEGLPWNAVVMPVLGVLFCFFGGRYRLLLPSGTAVLVFLFNLALLWSDSWRNAYDVGGAFLQNAVYALLIGGFCLVLCSLGMLAGALLQYGFSRPAETETKEKENRHEKQ